MSIQVSLSRRAHAEAQSSQSLGLRSMGIRLVLRDLCLIEVLVALSRDTDELLVYNRQQGTGSVKTDLGS